MVEPPGYVVRIERTFDAPAEAVFDAWTSPEVMRRWFHVEADWETPEAEVDLRIGGKIRVLMRRPDGTEHVIAGEFTEIERPQRLALVLGVGRLDHRGADQQRHRQGGAARRPGLRLAGLLRSARAGARPLNDREGGRHGRALPRRDRRIPRGPQPRFQMTTSSRARGRTAAQPTSGSRTSSPRARTAWRSTASCSRGIPGTIGRGR